MTANSPSLSVVSGFEGKAGSSGCNVDAFLQGLATPTSFRQRSYRGVPGHPGKPTADLEPADTKWLWFSIQDHKSIHTHWQLPPCAFWLMQIDHQLQLKSEENRGFCLHGSGFHAQLTFYEAISCSFIVVHHGSNHGDHRSKSDSTKGRRNTPIQIQNLLWHVYFWKNIDQSRWFLNIINTPQKQPQKNLFFYVNIA